MTRTLIIGRGYVGGVIAAALTSGGHAVETISARAILRGEEELSDTPDLVIFAHGMSVTGRGFKRRFDELLASRVEPLKHTQDLQTFTPRSRFVLISSITACLEVGGQRSLRTLQLQFEEAFLSSFPAGAILRVGAMLGSDSQLRLGLAEVRKTRFLKRLRLAGSTDIPWADARLLGAALRRVSSLQSRHGIVAYEKGFDLNALLEETCPARVRLTLPRPVAREIGAVLGIPRDFLHMSMRAAHASGWPFIGDNCATSA